MKIKEKYGGWQANIEYFEDYVIKTPKTNKQMREVISSYLTSIGKMEELEKRLKDMKKGWKEGIRILSKKRIPSKMLGYLEFLKDGKIKQKKVIILEDFWNESVDKGENNKMKKAVDKTINFIIQLWKYGVHEKTGKIGYEFGLMGDEIILIDFGEICDKKEIVKKQIVKKYWKKNLEKHCRREVVDYFNKKADEKLTVKMLNNIWNTN